MNIISKNLTFREVLQKRKSTKYIILHHAAATKCSVEDIHRWHLNNGWAGIGYHFLVRKDGSVYCGRPEDTIGAHTYGSNSISIGICFEGNFENERMTDAQKKAGQQLVYELKKKYPRVQIKKHNDFGRTACPGKYFPFNEIKNYNPNLTNTVNNDKKMTYSYNALTGVRMVKTPIENFKIVYWDARKKTTLHRNYCNAGFFGWGANGSTAPGANLVIDGTIKSQCYTSPSWHNFCKKKVSTFIVTKDNKCSIQVVDRVDNIPNVKYAISGLPVTENYSDVSWANFAKPQGWFGNELSPTKHIFLSFKDGYVYIFGFATKTRNNPYRALTEVWKKLKPYNFKDILMLDGGGSYIMNINGKAVDYTSENRRINTIIKF
nr:MAG TPA: endodeoxyribonuclease I [Caudoviricetes sp.]